MINNDRLLVQILLLVLFGASFWVMAPFWSALFWGAVLAFASWPLMRLLTRGLNGRESLAAALLTMGWMVLVAAPSPRSSRQTAPGAGSAPTADRY